MKAQDNRTHKVRCHFGLPDYFKSYQKTSIEPVSKPLYMLIVKDYLKRISIAISQEAYVYRLPQRLGRIELRKNKREVTIDKNGNIKNTLCINWKATKALWEDSPRAKRKG